MSEPKRSAGRPKLLSALDLELWSAVTADVRPFRARKLHAKPEPIAASDTRPIGAASTYREAPPPAKAVPALSEIDHRTRTNLRRGRLDVDAKLDLHGMRQAEAHHALVGFFTPVASQWGESGDCRHRQRVGRRCGRRAATDGSAVAASACAARCRRRLWRSLPQAWRRGRPVCADSPFGQRAAR